MNITDSAKAFLEETMQEHGLKTIRVVFAGMG
ncbi:hypothetical protein BpOF4_19105 [Alkalihalophilus pseudofirmus OF4]|jgi:hypothetical protein|uniref:Uncharacterized protein n=3 Tax=Bacillaceae TaxID=186817 RepID=D3FSZ5_ALKPO|nr:hypothetical protein BpOF4_19105 [Alkalihalophilus pseudofirmus OF4]ERN53382.1 hypothetical protein A33I_11525 [Alkalihalophilus marmarensis DSM 21297]